MRWILCLVAAAAGALPSAAWADRGATSLEGGAILSGAWVAPGVGTGDSVFGTLGGGSIGARYAFRNDVEVTASGSWFRPVPFYNDNTTVTCEGSPCTGQLAARVSRMGVTVGADYVRGLVFRFHIGAEVGWTRVTFDRIAHTSGLTFSDRTIDAMIVAPRIGVEWSATDHLSFAVTPRIDFVLGEPQIAFTIPITASWSWYGWFR
jgi:hypothetical protein